MPSRAEGGGGGAAPEPARRSALLLGATGLVGRHCLELLLGDGRYDHVVALIRRRMAADHPRLEIRQVDFDRLNEAGDLFRVRDVFCCLGTTMRKAGSREAFCRVDVEYPAAAAALAGAAGASAFVVVSAVGADPGSRVFYNRAKGEMEARVAAARVGRTWFVRPSLLLGERKEAFFGERTKARFGDRAKSRIDERTKARVGERTKTRVDELTEKRVGERADTRAGEWSEARIEDRADTRVGERAETRVGERLAEFALRPITPLMRGRLRRYRPVQAADVAASMLALARKPGGGVLESEHIPALAAEYHSISATRGSGRA